MSVIVIGASHHSMPLEMFERFTLSVEARTKFVDGLLADQHLSEVVVLSTCNRTEVYGFAERFHGAYSDIRGALALASGLDIAEFGPHLYIRWGEAAVDHLFSVASGLDSAVVGETEILGQIRTAWDASRIEGSAGVGLNLAFRRALEVGKRARRDTSISTHTTSVAGAAVELVSAHAGDLSSTTAVIFGAGTMARSVARSLAPAVGELKIVSRTLANAERLAAEVGATGGDLAAASAFLDEADVIVSATSAEHHLLDVEDVVALSPRRRVMVDIAMPRDLDPAIGYLDDVHLMDMDDVQALTKAGLDRRRGEIAAVRDIIAEAVARYMAETSMRDAGPLIAEMRDQVEAVRQAELRRYRGAIGRMSAKDQELLDQVTKTLLAKIMHRPTIQIRDAAGTLRGDRLADAAVDLFGLDDPDLDRP